MSVFDPFIAFALGGGLGFVAGLATVPGYKLIKNMKKRQRK